MEQPTTRRAGDRETTGWRTGKDFHFAAGVPLPGRGGRSQWDDRDSSRRAGGETPTRTRAQPRGRAVRSVPPESADAGMAWSQKPPYRSSALILVESQPRAPPAPPAGRVSL